MTSAHNGGPAYPTIAGQTVYSNGMSLRDAVAISVLPAVMARMHEDIQHLGSPTFPKNVCAHAFKIADAFLVARATGADT